MPIDSTKWSSGWVVSVVATEPSDNFDEELDRTATHEEVKKALAALGWPTDPDAVEPLDGGGYIITIPAELDKALTHTFGGAILAVPVGLIEGGGIIDVTITIEMP